MDGDICFIYEGGLVKVDNVAPLSGSTRMADLNRIRDARSILFIYLFFFFQKCPGPTQMSDLN